MLVSSFDEKLPKDRFPAGDLYAMETARHKALHVAAQVAEHGAVVPHQQQPVDLIISADTVRLGPMGCLPLERTARL